MWGFNQVPPRITLVEFDRWIENPDLLDQLTTAANPEPGDNLQAKLKLLRESLLVVEAYLARVESDRAYRDAGLDPEALTAALNTLPDPAVTGIELVMSATQTVRRDPNPLVSITPVRRPEPVNLANVLRRKTN